VSGPFQNAPWPTVNNNSGALLDPFSGVPDPNNANIYWRQTFVSEPAPWLPYDKSNQIGFFNRFYVLPAVNNETVNTTVIRQFQVDIPGFIYELTAAAVDTAGAALPAGLDSLDTFTAQIIHPSGDLLTTRPALGSAIFGDAKFPAKTGLSAWKLNRGSVVNFEITPRRPNLLINILVKFIEIRAGSNFGSLG
jgi:hypothetical protein